jgi:basic membrane protein A
MIVETILNKRAEGVLGGEHLELSFANGGLELVYNEALSAEITDEMKAKVEEAKQQLIDGTLEISLD